jgi:hypothetical protein
MNRQASREWAGFWETEAPLTPDEWAADLPLIEGLLAAIPAGVTVRDMSVWVHGREYHWRRIDVTTI